MNLGARVDFATLKGQIATQLSRNLAENGGLSKISDKQLNMRASEVRVAMKLTPDQRAKMEVTRRRLITEMLETEVTYVQGLQVLTKVYRIPLLQTDILPKAQVDKLFSNIESLLELNERFCAELRAIAESRTQCVGPLFISYAPLFRIYKTFVNNHESAASQLGKLLADRGGMQRFKDFHKECEQKPEAQGLSLASFLIMPIQRIPRYKLLLVEVIKNTPPEHPDDKLVQGHDELRDIAMEINNSIKEIENRTKLLALQTTCDTPLFAPNRWFIREGDLTKKCRAGDKKFTYFLFSDMLMYGTRLPLNKYKISHKIPIDQAFQLKDSEVQFGWQLINSVKSFIVYAMDEAEKNQWVADITECVTKFQESLKGKNASGDSTAKPIWESNANSDACPLCQKKFTTFFRRHHCRKCGQLCCSECSRFAVEKKGDRYCVKCFAEAGYQEDTEERQSSSHRRNESGSTEVDTPTSRKSVTAEMMSSAAAAKPRPPPPKSMSISEDIAEEGEGEDAERRSESKKDDKSPKIKLGAKIQRFGAVKAPPGPHFPGCFKEGFLNKKGEKLNTWKRRYFVLQNGKLMYFETLDTKKLGGQVEISKTSTFGVRGTSLAFWVCPVPNAPVMELEAEDAATRDSWVEALRQFTMQSSAQLPGTLSPTQSSANITDELISKMSVILTQKPQPQPPPRHMPKASSELVLPVEDEHFDLGWKQLVDEDSGSPFYWHEVTGESSWDVPPDYKPGN